MFDPERDEDPGARPFYRRLLAVMAITIAASAALWPSVTGFSAGPDHQTGCLAIVDGWRADKAAPSASDSLRIQAVFPAPLSQSQFSDPEAVARFREQYNAAQANPDVQRANAYVDWAAGPGACVHESRHRLIRSGLGLAGLAGFIAGAAYFRRTRRSLRPAPAEVATA